MWSTEIWRISQTPTRDLKNVTAPNRTKTECKDFAIQTVWKIKRNRHDTVFKDYEREKKCLLIDMSVLIDNICQ